jgi:predicted regulator of Ras-like GTPase activity (Roadblock/LC7/MglB family)
VDAARALTELTEISSQIEAAVLFDKDGTVLASTLADEAAAGLFAEAARSLLEQAASSAPAQQPLVQFEAATLDGSLFVVRDQERVVAAATRPEPTSGLVFFDLKSCLRAAAAEQGDGRPRPQARRPKPKGSGDRASAA